MNSQDIRTALDLLRKQSKKRKFTQSVDLIFNLQQLNLKNPEEQVNLFIALPHAKGKPVRICGLVDKEMKKAADEAFDKALLRDDFLKLDAKALSQLARQFDFFVAQATIMPDVAKFFGKILGPKGKMPSPKAGCVVPPNANLKALADRLRKTIRLAAKSERIAKAAIGTEAMTDEELEANILAATQTLLQSLPREKENLKNVLLKFTMSSPVEIGGKTHA